MFSREKTRRLGICQKGGNCYESPVLSSGKLDDGEDVLDIPVGAADPNVTTVYRRLGPGKAIRKKN
jgi:hypothetical protein